MANLAVAGPSGGRAHWLGRTEWRYSSGGSRTSGDDYISSSDAATRALSVTVFGNDLMDRVYAKLASTYDWTYGWTLHAGRLQAIQRMGIKPSDRILEVGVGTGINAALYPRECAVTGVDYSPVMLEEARKRFARKGVSNVRLLEMDGADLQFADDSFDVVYAPYVISVVPDPVSVAIEMHRVCRPGGRIIFLNHFRSPNSGARRHRAPDFAAHHSRRVQGRPRPAGISGPGRTHAGLDREGEHSADLVARDLRQVTTDDSPRSPALTIADSHPASSTQAHSWTTLRPPVPG